MKPVPLQHRLRFALALCVALGLWLLTQPMTARAETITVTTTADDGVGSLRAAIHAAHPGDTIIFDDGLSGLTITLASQLDIAKSLTIDGSSLAAPLTLDGDHATRLFYVQADGALTLGHLRLINGNADSGGGIYNAGTLQVTESTLSANSAITGGGLYNTGGTVTVTASVFVSNTATTKGGGLYTHVGTVTVLDSTLAHNRTTHIALANGYGGGGLYNNGSTLNVKNSTIANNAAPYNTGGGLYNATSNTSMATVVQASTISGNSAGYVGGIWNESGNLDLRQTIVANSSGGYDCGKGMDSGYVSSVASLFEATGGNACGNDHYYSILGVDPLLGPLADNGGKTPTFALLPDSPAIDAVFGWTCLAADQRGAPRNDLACDIGAFELQHVDSPTVVKSGLTTGVPYSFGPTRLRITVTGGDAGTITATKRLVAPGGVYNTGEITATWWLTASHSPFTATLALCYTPEELGDLNADGLQAFRWNTTELTWTLPISTGLTVAEGCVTLTGIEAFSAWTLKDVSVGAEKPTAARVVALAARGIAPGAALPLAGLLALGGVVTLFRRKQRL